MDGSHYLFIILVVSYFVLYGKWLNNTNQRTDGTLWFVWFFLFRDIFRNSIFQCILVTPWLTVGPLGIQVAHSPPLSLAHFWHLLVPCWLPLGPFGSLLESFSSRMFSFFINWIYISWIYTIDEHFYEFPCFSWPISEENSQQPDPRTPNRF